MTDDEARALGERWINAGGGWPTPTVAIDGDGRRWLVFEGSGRLVCGQGIGHSGWIAGWETTTPIMLPSVVPDLRDPATRGAALDVVRERWPGFTLVRIVRGVGPDGPIYGGWVACRGITTRGVPVACFAATRDGPMTLDDRREFESEAEAIVTALEVYPR